MARFAAFLRGINSGRNPSLKMAELKLLFEDLNLTEVATALASGNVVFTANIDSASKLEQLIESAFESKLGYPSSTIVLSAQELDELVAQAPFKADTNLKPNVSLVGKSGISKSDWDAYSLKTDGYEIPKVTELAIYSIVDLNKAGSPDLMKVLDKHFGKDVTTRTWNTILKVQSKLDLA